MTGSETDHRVELGDLTRSLGFLLRLAQLQAFETFYARMPTHGLKPGEFTVLWVVGLNPGQRQGNIADRLRIKPAHMTKLLQRLVAAGLVTRSVPKTDRRSMRLYLTAEGRDFVDRHRSSLLDLHAPERYALGEEEAAELLRLLGKLAGLEGQE